MKDTFVETGSSVGACTAAAVDAADIAAYRIRGCHLQIQYRISPAAVASLRDLNPASSTSVGYDAMFLLDNSCCCSPLDIHRLLAMIHLEVVPNQNLRTDPRRPTDTKRLGIAAGRPKQIENVAMSSCSHLSRQEDRLEVASSCRSSKFETEAVF